MLITASAFRQWKGREGEVEGMPWSFMGTWKLHNPIGQNFVIPSFTVKICVFILGDYKAGV